MDFFLPHNLWRILVIFSLQKCPCPLLSLFHLSVSAQSFAFFFNLLTVFLHPPSHTNFLSNTEQEKDFRGKFTGRKHREQSPHISSSQPNALCFSCHFSPFPLQISPDPLYMHRAEVRTGHIQLYLTGWELFSPFLRHTQALTPFPKWGTLGLHCQACMSMRVQSWAGENVVNCENLKYHWHWHIPQQSSF